MGEIEQLREYSKSLKKRQTMADSSQLGKGRQILQRLQICCLRSHVWELVGVVVVKHSREPFRVYEQSGLSSVG